MGYTLDQLLDQTGLNELTEPTMSKTAAPSDTDPCDLPKLAERCRNAASDINNENTARALTEKTASVAIIRHVLAEIDEITGGEQTYEKRAEDVRTAAFISRSLAAGHKPEDIAAFMQKNAGIFGRAMRSFERWRGGRAVAKLDRAVARSSSVENATFNRWSSLVARSKRLPMAEREALIAKMHQTLGPKRTMKIFAANPDAAKAFRNVNGFKDLEAINKTTIAKADEIAAAAKPKAAVLGINEKTIKKYKKPAMYVGGGALAYRTMSRPQPQKKRSGVVVVNS